LLPSLLLSMMKHLVALASLLLLPALLVGGKQPDVGATVQTSSGPVTGHAALNQTQVSEYLGIPYAQPPLGNLRFAPPQTYSSQTPLTGSSYVSQLFTTASGIGDTNTERNFLVPVCAHLLNEKEHLLMSNLKGLPAKRNTANSIPKQEPYGTVDYQVFRRGRGQPSE